MMAGFGIALAFYRGIEVQQDQDCAAHYQAHRSRKLPISHCAMVYLGSYYDPRFTNRPIVYPYLEFTLFVNKEV